MYFLIIYKLIFYSEIKRAVFILFKAVELILKWLAVQIDVDRNMTINIIFLVCPFEDGGEIFKEYNMRHCFASCLNLLEDKRADRKCMYSRASFNGQCAYLI